MNERQRENAHRLAHALSCVQEDSKAIEQLAKVLNYLPEQLSKDCGDLMQYIRQLETGAKTGAKKNTVTSDML